MLDDDAIEGAGGRLAPGVERSAVGSAGTDDTLGGNLNKPEWRAAAGAVVSKPTNELPVGTCPQPSQPIRLRR